MIPFLTLFCITQLSVSQVQMPVYPAYKEVANEFFSNYSTDGQNQQQRLSLAKKPDGWHAMMVDYNTNQVVQDELFWSRKKKTYLKIAFAPYDELLEDPNRKQIVDNQWAQTASGLVPFWGYYGWETDVIKTYAGKKKLSDSLLNSVARAYSSNARNLTRVPEFGNPGEYEKIPKGSNAMSPELLAAYLKNHRMASTFYDLLYKQNPKFETFVSGIYNVYSNDIMDAFLTLRYFQNEETASEVLKKDLYTPFYLEMARNYLNSCDKDAILFTNGDMDTYPLLYVQKMENYRKDILVINLSLLNLGRYIYHLVNFRGGARPLKTTLDPEIYKSELKPFFYIIENSDYPIHFKDVAGFISSTDPDTKYKFNDHLIDYIPSRDIFFRYDSEKIKELYPYTNAEKDSIFNIHLSTNYLTVSDFCVLDILATNGFERPVYYAITVDQNSYSLLQNHLTLSGLAYKFNPVRNADFDQNNAFSVQAEHLYNKLFNDLHFNSASAKANTNSEKGIISLYRYMFSMLSDKLIQENEHDKALLVMDRCLSLFPLKIAEYDYVILGFIRNYFKIIQLDKAKQLIVEFMQFTEIKINKLLKENDLTKNKPEIHKQVYFLIEMERISAEFIPDEEISRDLLLKTEQYKNLLDN